jgi:predicted PolB exonuclease-like 3'-5' exonuclease
MKLLFVNLETLPDIDGARRMFELPAELQEKDVAKVLFHQHVSTRGREQIFLQPWQARIAVIRVIAISDVRARLFSFDMQQSEEMELLQQLHDVLDDSSDTFCWDQGRDLNALLHIRSMIHELKFDAAPLRTVEQLLRMQTGSNSLEAIAARFGLQAMAMQGDELSWKQYRQQGIEPLCQRCQTNVIATAHLGLRHLLTAGELERQHYNQIMTACGEL